MEQPETQPGHVVRGFHQYCSFGKFASARKTFYDLANDGEFKYLLYCNEVCSNRRRSSWFSISDTCRPHIQAALRTKEMGGVWERKEKESLVPGIFEVWYETDTDLKGPTIMYQKCKACGQKKNQSTVQRGICDKCAKK
jgi:hypothetical protein